MLKPMQGPATTGHFARRQLGAIFVGGACGALLRIALLMELPVGKGDFPSTVLGINVGGTLLLTYLVTRLEERLPPNAYLRPALATGFCGAFTTFSTLEAGVAGLAEGGHASLAVLYAAGSLLGGAVAAWLGTALARRTRLLL